MSIRSKAEVFPEPGTSLFIMALLDKGAKLPSDMGKVMGIATKQLAGKADNKTIAAAVKEILSGN